jgi:hypothetical protein
MARLFSYRSLGLPLLLSLCVPFLLAQDAAQQASCNQHHVGSKYCDRLAREFASRDLSAGRPVQDLDNPFTFTDEFAIKVAPKAALRLLSSDLAKQTARQILSTSAAVTQVGGAPTANGSTNLVSKPTTTDFMSLASESGAFTDTINGTTATIQANALGLTKYFANQPVFERWESRYADFIQPLTFAVTLNVAQTGSSTATTAGSANAATPTSIASVLLPANNVSFSSFAANYSVYRPYNPQDKKFLDSWSKALAKNQGAMQDATRNIASDVNKLFTTEVKTSVFTQMGTPLNTWHSAAVNAEGAGDFDAFVSAYSAYLDAFADAVLATPDAPKNVLALSQAIDAFNQIVYDVLNDARGTPLATLSYSYSTPPDKPATHSFTAALSYLFKGDDPTRRTPLTGAELTANFTTSIYASLPAGAAYGRLRDFQLSGEFDKPFGGTPDEPRGTWSLAGYGQYQYDPTVLNITAGNLAPGTNIALPSDAQVLLGTAGWLGVAQGKVVINLKKGLNIPVALKWSNKTDLLKGSDVRGQVGISYDLSALSKLLSGGSN